MANLDFEYDGYRGEILPFHKSYLNSFVNILEQREANTLAQEHLQAERVKLDKEYARLVETISLLEPGSVISVRNWVIVVHRDSVQSHRLTTIIPTDLTKTQEGVDKPSAL